MPRWGSAWLENARQYDPLPEDASVCSAPSKQSGSLPSTPGTSGRQSGWFNVVQGIRRSLDVHLKSYYKVDNAFSNSLKHGTAREKLMSLASALVDTGLIDFCGICLVNPARNTFGVVAVAGPGSELFPALLTPTASSSAAAAGLQQELACDSNSEQACSASERKVLTIFNRSVFKVQDSNWAVEDVTNSQSPWYYDCSTSNGASFGLPQEATWLKRAGMRSVLALPCVYQQDVYGVLTVATRQKTVDHLLLRKLEELCYKVTPLVVDAGEELSRVLCNRRIASRYESVSDFAHALLGEMLNLDRAVSTSVQAMQRQQQQQPTLSPAAACASRAAVSTSAEAATPRLRAPCAISAPAPETYELGSSSEDELLAAAAQVPAAWKAGLACAAAATNTISAEQSMRTQQQQPPCLFPIKVHVAIQPHIAQVAPGTLQAAVASASQALLPPRPAHAPNKGFSSGTTSPARSACPSNNSSARALNYAHATSSEAMLDMLALPRQPLTSTASQPAAMAAAAPVAAVASPSAGNSPARVPASGFSYSHVPVHQQPAAVVAAAAARLVQHGYMPAPTVAAVAAAAADSKVSVSAYTSPSICGFVPPRVAVAGRSLDGTGSAPDTGASSPGQVERAYMIDPIHSVRSSTDALHAGNCKHGSSCSLALLRGAPLEPSIGTTFTHSLEAMAHSAAAGDGAPVASPFVAPLAHYQAATLSTQTASACCAGFNTTASASHAPTSAASLSSGWCSQMCPTSMVAHASAVDADPRVPARCSRESSTAAAAMWGNEVAQAIAAAAKFTSAPCPGGIPLRCMAGATIMESESAERECEDSCGSPCGSADAELEVCAGPMMQGGLDDRQAAKSFVAEPISLRATSFA